MNEARTPKRLLVVDDDPDVLEALEAVLSEDFEVATAADGAVALEHLQCAEVDVVLLDMMMPNMDGEEVIAAMKGSGMTIPVLLGSAMPGIERRARKLGVVAITKPYNVTNLVARLQRLAEEAPGAGSRAPRESAEGTDEEGVEGGAPPFVPRG